MVVVFDCADVPAGDLAAAVAAILGRPVTLTEDRDMNGKGIYRISGRHRGPLRWLDAPVYEVRPAVR